MPWLSCSSPLGQLGHHLRPGATSCGRSVLLRPQASRAVQTCLGVQGYQLCGISWSSFLKGENGTISQCSKTLPLSLSWKHGVWTWEVSCLQAPATALPASSLLWGSREASSIHRELSSSGQAGFHGGWPGRRVISGQRI